MLSLRISFVVFLKSQNLGLDIIQILNYMKKSLKKTLQSIPTPHHLLPYLIY
jgi:hypothetical protein